jgi:hypothetical protein
LLLGICLIAVGREILNSVILKILVVINHVVLQLFNKNYTNPNFTPLWHLIMETKAIMTVA